MNSKLWGGRFSRNTDNQVLEFTESISFDRRLAIYDIKASIAHTEMLVHSNIISKKEGFKIIKGLQKIKDLIKKNKFHYSIELEDIHLNIESYLIKLIGETGKKLHTARSRNDQILVDVYLYLKDEIKKILHYITTLEKKFLQIAEKNINIIMPGYTHLQQAQPILFSHYLMAYFFKLERDRRRFNNNLLSVDILPLGVGAVAGLNYKIDRKYVANLLGFSKVTRNSVDTVSNRDFIIEFITDCSILGIHLSRLAEDFIIWNTEEFNFIEIDDAYTTGSSIMPNKKNPDILELIRGKISKIIANTSGIFNLLKGLPLTYNRDLQEDKKFLFETVDYIEAILKIIIPLLSKIKINEHSINEKMRNGFTLATDIADYLVKKNISFREAHNITGRIIKYCVDNKKSLFELTIKEFKRFNKNFDNQFLKILNYKSSINSKVSYGSTSYVSVKQQIKYAKKILK